MVCVWCWTAASYLASPHELYATLLSWDHGPDKGKHKGAMFLGMEMYRFGWEWRSRDRVPKPVVVWIVLVVLLACSLACSLVHLFACSHTHT